MWFPSPHSGILFLWRSQSHLTVHLTIRRFRPLIRGFFFYKSCYRTVSRFSLVSVPSFGDSFFIADGGQAVRETDKVVSVPSFGDSFFIKDNHDNIFVACGCFRPLIRGFFFYPVVMICRQVWTFLLSFGGSSISLHKKASLWRNPYISLRTHRHRRGLNLFSSMLYRLQFLLINILSHRLLLYHLCPTILPLYSHRGYKYAGNPPPHLWFCSPVPIYIRIVWVSKILQMRIFARARQTAPDSVP